MRQYKIKELWTVQQQEDEGPYAFMTRIRTVAREAFRKLPAEEQHVTSGHAFWEGLSDRSLAVLVATQAGNSGARAVEAEAIADNCKKMERKGRSKISKKALLRVPIWNAEGYDYSSEVSGSLGESGIRDLRLAPTRSIPNACSERRAGFRE